MRFNGGSSRSLDDECKNVRWFFNDKNINKSKHFGVNVSKKDGLYLTRDNYCRIRNKSSFKKDVIYTDEFCEQHYIKCMKNFDLSMIHFSLLDRCEFYNSISEFQEKFHFSEVTNLNDYAGKQGYYLMVIDEYKQVYIGTSSNIKVRIMSHWSKQKEFDRLIFGSVETSIISIDSFRALDTTRIYAHHIPETFSYEDDYINSFNHKFLSNRMKGGKIESGGIGLIEAWLSSRKIRNLGLFKK